MAEVAAMYVFSGMSGSKGADMAAVGTAMRGPLRERGYAPGESVAVLSASAVMGETVPPSIAMLVLGSITTISIASLFLAGLVPAAVLGLALLAGIVLRSNRHGDLSAAAPFSLTKALAAILPAIPALLVPVIVIGSIVTGISTPTEGSSIAVVYGVVAAAVVYRSLHRAVLWRLLRDATLTAGMVLMILSTASLLTQAFVLDGLDRTVAAFLTGTGSSLGFLLLTALTLIVLGQSVGRASCAHFVWSDFCSRSRTRDWGIDPLQYAVVIIIAMGLGAHLPPFGIGLYIACSAGGSTIQEALGPSLFYSIVLFAGLLFIVAIPQITTLVPRLVGVH